MNEQSSLAEIVGFLRNVQNGGYIEIVIELCKARMVKLDKNHVNENIEALKELARMMK